ncbi:MAG: hypothetical protein JSW23_02485, partial [Planctomycetota bacterium]
MPETRQEVQSRERHKYYENVYVSAVDVTPKYSDWDDEPDVQYIPIGSKNEYEDKDGYEKVGESRRTDIK